MKSNGLHLPLSDPPKAYSTRGRNSRGRKIYPETDELVLHGSSLAQPSEARILYSYFGILLLLNRAPLPHLNTPQSP